MRVIRDLKPLNQDIVDITEPVMGQGLVVVELCGGILSATEALHSDRSQNPAALRL